MRRADVREATVGRREHAATYGEPLISSITSLVTPFEHR